MVILHHQGTKLDEKETTYNCKCKYVWLLSHVYIYVHIYIYIHIYIYKIYFDISIDDELIHSKSSGEF